MMFVVSTMIFGLEMTFRIAAQLSIWRNDRHERRWQRAAMRLQRRHDTLARYVERRRRQDIVAEWCINAGAWGREIAMGAIHAAPVVIAIYGALMLTVTAIYMAARIS